MLPHICPFWQMWVFSSVEALPSSLPQNPFVDHICSFLREQM